MKQCKICGWIGTFPAVQLLTVTFLASWIVDLDFAHSQPASQRVDLYGDAIPNDAVLRLGSQRFHQHRSANCAVILPDNKTLLVVGEQLVYYELPSGKLLKRFPIRIRDFNNQQTVVTPDNKLIGVTGFRFDHDNAETLAHIKLIETETGNERFSISTNERLVEKGLVIAPDGSTLAKLGRNTRIWDVASGEEVLEYTIDGVRDGAPGAFSPDGKSLAIGKSNAVVLWNWTAGDEPESISLGPASKRIDPQSIVFTADGKTLYVGTRGALGIIRIDIPTKSISGLLGPASSDGYTFASDMQLSRDGKQLVTVGDRSSSTAAIIWDLEKGRIASRLQGGIEPMRQVSCSLDGNYVAMSSGWSNLVEVYRVDTGEHLTGNLNNHRLGVNFLGFVPGKKLIASAGDDRTLRLWDINTGQLRLVMEHPGSDEGHSHWIRATAISPDGHFFATSSLDDTVRVWNAANGQQLYVLAGHGRFGGHRSLCFAPDSQHLFSFGDDRRVYTYEMKTGKAIDEYELNLPEFQNNNDPLGFDGGRGGISFILESNDFSEDGSLLVLNMGSVVLIETKTGEEKKRLTNDPNLSSFAGDAILSPDKKALLSGALGPPTRIPLKDGRVQFSSGEHHIINLFSVDSGELLAARQIDNVKVGPMAYRGDGRVIAVASGDRKTNLATIRFLAADDLSLLYEISGLVSHPRELAFSADGKLLAAGLQDTTILVWQIDL